MYFCSAVDEHCVHGRHDEDRKAAGDIYFLDAQDQCIDWFDALP